MSMALPKTFIPRPLRCQRSVIGHLLAGIGEAAPEVHKSLSPGCVIDQPFRELIERPTSDPY